MSSSSNTNKKNGRYASSNKKKNINNTTATTASPASDSVKNQDVSESKIVSPPPPPPQPTKKMHGDFVYHKCSVCRADFDVNNTDALSTLVCSEAACMEAASTWSRKCQWNLHKANACSRVIVGWAYLCGEHNFYKSMKRCSMRNCSRWITIRSQDVFCHLCLKTVQQHVTPALFEYEDEPDGDGVNVEEEEWPLKFCRECQTDVNQCDHMCFDCGWWINNGHSYCTKCHKARLAKAQCMVCDGPTKNGHAKCFSCNFGKEENKCVDCGESCAQYTRCRNCHRAKQDQEVQGADHQTFGICGGVGCQSAADEISEPLTKGYCAKCFHYAAEFLA